MKNVNGWMMQAMREAGSIFESIWQSLKDSGPCCGIRFSRATESPMRNDPILCSCYKMRM
jgi:hypothetical protein